MSTQTIYDALSLLKLTGAMAALKQLEESPKLGRLSFEDKLWMLLDSELNEREQRKQKRLFRLAKLKQPLACIEDIDYVVNRGLDRSQVQSLVQCEWALRHQYLIITGSTGVGKSWLACAFANQMIRMGHSVMYKRFSLLLEDMDVARRDGSLPKLRAALVKVRLLILDDWAMAPLRGNNRQDLLELVEARTDAGALLITSQLPVAQWHDYIGEPTVADAILDRIVHRAHRIELSGESMRKKHRLED